MCDSVRLLFFFFFFHGYRAVLSNANTSCAIRSLLGKSDRGAECCALLIFHRSEVVLNSALTNTAPFYSPATPLATTPYLHVFSLEPKSSPPIVRPTHACSRRSDASSSPRPLAPRIPAICSSLSYLLTSSLLKPARTIFRRVAFSAETSPRARARSARLLLHEHARQHGLVVRADAQNVPETWQQSRHHDVHWRTAVCPDHAAPDGGVRGQGRCGPSCG